MNAIASPGLAQMAGPEAGRVRSGLAELRTRYGLPPRAEEQLGALVDAVATDPLAPTTVREPGRILDEHLADSLVALEVAAIDVPARAVDLGAGAGFPGLALAIARPEVEFVLLEASGRKCAFIERAVTACRLGNVMVVNARAEEWRAGLGTFQIATARALAPLEVVLEYAAPLLAVGGRVVAWRGRRDRAAEARSTTAASALGLELGPVHRVSPFAGAEHRHIHLATKVAETPERFPRRVGMARKRPLGGR